jgi:hypothetical protein
MEQAMLTQRPCGGQHIFPWSLTEQEAATMQLNGQELQPILWHWGGITEAAQVCGSPQDTRAERADGAMSFPFLLQGTQCHNQSSCAGE